MFSIEIITGLVIVVGSIVAFLMALLVVQIYRRDKKDGHPNGGH